MAWAIPVKRDSSKSTASGIVAEAGDFATVENIENIQEGETTLGSNYGEVVGERRHLDVMSTAADAEKMDSGDCNASDIKNDSRFL